MQNTFPQSKRQCCPTTRSRTRLHSSRAEEVVRGVVTGIRRLIHYHIPRLIRFRPGQVNGWEPEQTRRIRVFDRTSTTSTRKRKQGVNVKVWQPSRFEWAQASAKILNNLRVLRIKLGAFILQGRILQMWRSERWRNKTEFGRVWEPTGATVGRH